MTTLAAKTPPMLSPGQTDASQPDAIRSIRVWWQSLAYQNSAAEWTLWTLLLTGLPLWKLWEAPWSLAQWSLALHCLLGVTAFFLWVLPFWLRHRQLLCSSRKPLLKWTGQLLDLLLMIIVLSGFGLFLIGNRGAEEGQWLLWAHLYSSLVIGPILLKHAWRWSVLHLRRKSTK